jgi:cyclic pyranopterin phosphate synthase
VAGEGARAEVLATARLAGIMAAKRTHEIIPLCPPISITHLELAIEIDEAGSSVHVTALVDAYDRTGCDMEAMVAVSTACLVLYDMLKDIDQGMVIGEVKLMEKSGGRSGHYARQ